MSIKASYGRLPRNFSFTVLPVEGADTEYEDPIEPAAIAAKSKTVQRNGNAPNSNQRRGPPAQKGNPSTPASFRQRNRDQPSSQPHHLGFPLSAQQQTNRGMQDMELALNTIITIYTLDGARYTGLLASLDEHRRWCRLRNHKKLLDPNAVPQDSMHFSRFEVVDWRPWDAPDGNVTQQAFRTDAGISQSGWNPWGREYQAQILKTALPKTMRVMRPSVPLNAKERIYVANEIQNSTAGNSRINQKARDAMVTPDADVSPSAPSANDNVNRAPELAPIQAPQVSVNEPNGKPSAVPDVPKADDQSPPLAFRDFVNNERRGLEKEKEVAKKKHEIEKDSLIAKFSQELELKFNPPMPPPRNPGSIWSKDMNWPELIQKFVAESKLADALAIGTKPSSQNAGTTAVHDVPLASPPAPSRPQIQVSRPTVSSTLIQLDQLNVQVPSNGLRGGGDDLDLFSVEHASLFHDPMLPDITRAILNKTFVAHGGHSLVYSAEWKNAQGPLTKVAVKILRGAHRNKTRKRLKREARIWKSLNHPNIVPLIALVMEDEGPGFVSPWYASGSILQYLKQARNVTREDLCEDVAIGLRYLHERDPPVVHGDLKGANILVGPDGRAALCDFGLSMVLDSNETGFTSSIVGGTLRFMAPEQLTDDTGGRSVQSDVYSYACTYAEIMTGEVPFHWHRTDAMIMRSISRGELPYKVGSIVSRHNLGFLELGWAAEPAHRPTVSNICVSLAIVDRL